MMSNGLDTSFRIETPPEVDKTCVYGKVCDFTSGFFYISCSCRLEYTLSYTDTLASLAVITNTTIQDLEMNYTFVP